MRGELQDTLSFLKTHGTTLVLGLRDVMDSPSLLQANGRGTMS
jgi:predicted glycosyltransferase